VDLPETHYVKVNDLHIGYQIWGEGPIDVLELHNGTLISIDETADESSWLRYEQRLSSFCRLIRFDYRGLGLSDALPAGAPPTLEDLASDAFGLLDAVGVNQAAVLGAAGGSLVALTMAHQRPDRVRQMVLINASARVPDDVDYPIGVPQALITAGVSRIDPLVDQEVEGLPDDLGILIPSQTQNQTFRRWWTRAARRGANPTTALAFNNLFFGADVRHLLPEITTEALVISRRQGFADIVRHGRYLAEHLPHARMVELDGTDLVPYGGDFESLVAEIEEFITGERAAPVVDRALLTVLFTDIVGSTALAAELGDRRWRRLLEDHDAAVRHEIARYDGRYVKNTGDGVLATFPSPARAAQCAAAIIQAARSLGLEIRAGLHVGEVELRGEDVGGIAVHIGARIGALAGPGEVLVSSTVRDLVVGSDLTFANRGTTALKGVPDEWRLYALVG
jgi:class 3 adenylate cyclase